MRTLWKTVIVMFALAVCLWLAAVAFLLLLRHDLIYPFRNWTDARVVTGLPGAAPRSFAAADGTEVIYWHVAPRGARPVILYFTGNAGSLPASAPRLAEMALRGYGIIALNYRGAGGAPGTPDEEVLVADAVALYDHALDRPPVIWGTSLGAALAVQVAARRPALALIAETPFTRLCDAAQVQYPYVPACLLLPDNHWASIDAIGQVDAPVLILHGDADRIVPVSQGQALFRAAGGPKEMRIYPGGRHNDLRLHGAGADIVAFLDRVGRNRVGVAD